MKIPYDWLQELLPDAPTVDTLTDLLDGLGLAVEQVEELPGAPGKVVVARIEGVEPLPDSDHLVVADATDGERRYRVVCGAPNARPGLLTALALPGATLPGPGLEVARRELRGVVSEGVLCSPRELGLFDYAGGLLELPADSPLGRPLAELWPSSTVLELELTPNRADCFSLLGVARDLAAKLDLPLIHPAASAPPADPRLDDGLTVRIEDPVACPRFTLRLIEGVQVGPSPIWLQRRLAQLGLRPRNNVVDVTNYITFELGQPAHAYDRSVLHDDTLVVRRARAGEKLVVLTEEEVELHPDDLVIATPSDGASGETRPVGLAGVIGGLHDSVRDDTREVALELAHFDPVVVRKTARRHGLSTDAHTRFERGVDPELPPLASARAAALICQVAGGRAHPGITDVGSAPPRKQVLFRPSRVPFLTALEVPNEQQQRFLAALGCEVASQAEDRWQVTAPSWRFDLAIEEDLVEEVARLHGYDKIGETIPAMDFVPPIDDPTHRGLRELLADMGFQETLSYIWTSPSWLEQTAAPPPRVKLASPLSAERNVLRTALYPSVLQTAVTNRAQPSLAIFEIGHVFADEEYERLGLLARGPWQGGGWLPEKEVDFYLFKGLLEALAGRLGAQLELLPAEVPYLHPGVGAAVCWEGREIGYAGRLHPEIAARLELHDAFLAELELPLEQPPIRFRDLVRQPYAERDLAVIAPVAVPYRELRRLAVEAAGPFLLSVEPFDVYQGPPIPEGQRSVALRFRFQHPERALVDDEVDGFMANVISALRASGYDIRDR